MSIAQMVWQLLKYFLLLYKAKRGACPPLFKARLEKYFVLYSKALSKMGLNLENHVYSSNRMAITEYLFLLYKAKKGACPPPYLGGV